MSPETSHAAFQRFADALERSRDAAALTAAVSDDIRIDRHAPGERGATTPVVEAFAGQAEVARWLARTPPAIQFALVGAPWPEPARPDEPTGDTWAIEYAITAGEFRNGGVWRARLAGDGRIAFLSHHPFALPPGT